MMSHVMILVVLNSTIKQRKKAISVEFIALSPKWLIKKIWITWSPFFENVITFFVVIS